MMIRPTALLAASLTLTACGSNYADVPPELLEAIKNRTASNYPPGPYGTEVGDTVRDMCFTGWRDPKAADFDPTEAAEFCIGEYHDPTGARTKLLLVNSGALWCVACRSEYGGSGDRPSLSQHLGERIDHGFRVIGTLYQDDGGQPATTTDAASWARTYDLQFPFGADPLHQFGLFTKPNVAPFNLLIDTRTMKVVLGVPGDEPAQLFQRVDDFLAANAGP
jgi:hypothetical protein